MFFTFDEIHADLRLINLDAIQKISFDESTVTTRPHLLEYNHWMTHWISIYAIVSVNRWHCRQITGFFCVVLVLIFKIIHFWIVFNLIKKQFIIEALDPDYIFTCCVASFHIISSFFFNYFFHQLTILLLFS